MVEEAMLAANVCVAEFFVEQGLGQCFQDSRAPPASGLDRFSPNASVERQFAQD